ncbi:MAG: hypothetical protein ACHQWV_05255 [Nitrospirales bacterium]
MATAFPAWTGIGVPAEQGELPLMRPPVLILFLSFLFLSGCTRGPTAVLDPASHDPGQDHWAIASYYSREAALSRQQAEALTNRVAVYERLFGQESDWVTGTRLLVQYYEEAAHEQDRLADLHLELSRGRSPRPLIQSRGH